MMSWGAETQNPDLRAGRGPTCSEEIDDEDDPSIDVSNSQSSHIIYEKEEKIKIDYSSLNSSLTVSAPAGNHSNVFTITGF